MQETVRLMRDPGAQAAVVNGPRGPGTVLNRPRYRPSANNQQPTTRTREGEAQAPTVAPPAPNRLGKVNTPPR